MDGGKLRRQRQTLIDNIRESKAHNKNTSELLRMIRRQNDSFRQVMRRNEGDSLLAQDFLLPTAPFAPVLIALLDEFEEGKEVGIFSTDRAPLLAKGEHQPYSTIAVSIRALLKLATSTGHWLNVAIFALLVLYLGRLQGDDKLLDLARRAYGQTLDRTRTTIAKLPRTAQPSNNNTWIRVACQLATLRLFEVSYRCTYTIAVE